MGLIVGGQINGAARRSNEICQQFLRASLLRDLLEVSLDRSFDHLRGALLRRVAQVLDLSGKLSVNAGVEPFCHTKGMTLLEDCVKWDRVRGASWQVADRGVARLVSESIFVSPDTVAMAACDVQRLGLTHAPRG